MPLGSEDGFDKKKALFITYIVAIFMFMFLASLGGSLAVRSQIMFYITFSAVCFGLPFIVDQMSFTSKYIDTVTWEQPDEKKPWQSYWVQGLVALAVAGITFWRGITLKKAWINAPQFTIFETPIGNGILSGFAIAENWIAFSFIFPTLFTNFERKWGGFRAFLAAAFITSLLFMGAHKLWVYKYNEVALLSTFLFGFVNCAFVYAFRSVFVSDVLHFSNNFVLGAGIAQKVGFSVAV